MVAHDACNVGIVFDLRQNAFSDDGVLLHLSPLIKRQRSRLLEEAGGKTHLANIVHKTTQMNECLLLGAQTHALCDVARIDGNSR